MPPMSSSRPPLLKRPSSSQQIPEDLEGTAKKRVCLEQSLVRGQIPQMSIPKNKNPLDIQAILNLTESTVLSLRKQDLRNYFLLLQQYALNPYPFSPPTQAPGLSTTTSDLSLSTASTPIIPTSLLFRLPLELRHKIYKYLLPPPSTNTTPMPGPHPRPLQSPLHLSHPIHPLLPLLLVSHQLHSELLPSIWGPPQTIHIKISYKIWLHKYTRSELILPPSIISNFKSISLLIDLGDERLKKGFKPSPLNSFKEKGAISTKEAEARLGEVKKGIRKFVKWIVGGGAKIEELTISWQEPSEVFRWETKKEVLEGLRGLGARKVRVGRVNWGLDEGWNRGGKWRFREGWVGGLGWEGGGREERGEN